MFPIKCFISPKNASMPLSPGKKLNLMALKGRLDSKMSRGLKIESFTQRKPMSSENRVL